MSLILGIESSCDETAAAVVADGCVVLSNVIASQHDLHATYGGVVPEIASRAHLERILPVIEEAMRDAGCSSDQLTAIAVGHRPGLIGSLLVGLSAAKALAWAWKLPLVGVDHVEAHLYAPVLQLDAAEPGGVVDTSDDCYPALGLVVSGGHTAMYCLTSPTRLERVGSTIDDAVGEAYDKAAIILGLGYPGGPKLDALARTGSAERAIGGALPRSLLAPDSLDFSFSGLKTALLYRVRGYPVGKGSEARFERGLNDLTPSQIADLAAAFQAAAVEVIVTKLTRAHQHLTDRGLALRSLLVGGGVSANSLLRARLLDLGDRLRLRVRQPGLAVCVDNAAMLAGLAHHQLAERGPDPLTLAAVATTSR